MARGSHTNLILAPITLDLQRSNTTFWANLNFRHIILVLVVYNYLATQGF